MRDEAHTVQDALFEEEGKFQALLELSADAVVITDPTGGIIQANARAALVFGHERAEDLAGVPGFDLVAPESRAAALEGLRAAQEGNPRSDVTYTLVRRDGTTFEGNVNAATITDEQGQPNMFIIAFRDMTEVRQAEEAVAQYQVWLRRMAADLVLVEERERRRIASELHDRVGQSLALCRLRMSSLLDAPDDDATPLEEIAELLDFTIQDVRTLTVELSPPVLYELSFVDAVAWLGDRTRERGAVEVKVTDDGREKPLAEDCAFDLLEQAVESVMAGKLFLSPRVAEVVNMTPPPQEEPPDPPRLTPRQREVLQLYAEGHSTRQIAEALGLSIKTVETHRSHIMEKLGLKTIAELTRYAIRAGITSLDL